MMGTEKIIIQKVPGKKGRVVTLPETKHCVPVWLAKQPDKTLVVRYEFPDPDVERVTMYDALKLFDLLEKMFPKHLILAHYPSI